MGRYIAQGDLDEYLSEDALRQLTDDSNNKEADAAIVAECIAGAEDYFDGHIAHRYTVPLSSHTGIVDELCVVFATQRLYARRGRMPEPFEKIYEDAMKTLEKIAKGEIIIDGADESESEVDVVEVTTQTRVHDRSKWSGW
jgi:phage gp36-like protein